MNTNHNRQLLDLESATSKQNMKFLSQPPPLHLHLHPSDTDSDVEKDQLPHHYHHEPTTARTIYTHHPILSQRRLHLLTLVTALTVGLGLGAAVGTWSCIHTTLSRNPHLLSRHATNIICGVLMGFVLAPVLETASRALLTKLCGGVLATPTTITSTKGRFWSRHAVLHRMAAHLVAITAAAVAIGAVKGVQMQYEPLRGRVCCEFPVFVLGFTGYGALRAVLWTVVFDVEMEEERVARGYGWGAVVRDVVRSVAGLFRGGKGFLTVVVRDAVTFCVYPYLGGMWTGWWTAVVDPEGRAVWVAEGMNIGFFFTWFSVVKEVTEMTAALLWKEV